MTSPKVAVFGEALIDMIQQQDGSYLPFIGGSPFNVARSFVKQGIDCTYLSPISTDFMGEQIYASVLKDGVKVPPNNRSEKNSSLALVYKDAEGKPSYRLYRKGVADLDITADALLAMLPVDIDVFHTGSLALVPEMLEVLIPVVIKLKSRGVKISIDVNVRKGVETNHQQYVAAIWRFVEFADIVKVSDEDLELKGLYGRPEFHAKAMLDRMQNGMVVLTLGEGGSHLITSEHNLKQAVHVPEVFGDTVGAGDTYFSALIARLLKADALSPKASTEKLSDALRFGAVAASLNVATVGCNPPTCEEVEAVIKAL
ncbi:MAG: carbohydrate kinase [Paraglaciecola sp.]|uniref:carbohydrate kinase family protein n=1 Tax=Paraglaciecola sp. TaxID=1920173 RepID=UPI00273D0757|nr:carbohydrate kinase [Paraglaciecola sp.]MDP5033082.1 carbohydrate kinase [Paraglaciecola sp.]MDP5130336.1 carbohydrate kinase [Paraglaciecola sp.]